MSEDTTVELQVETEAKQAEPGRHPIEIVADILSLYATMINGHIWRNLAPGDRLAALMCARDVFEQAHEMAITSVDPDTVPAWIVDTNKTHATARLMFERLTTTAPAEDPSHE